MKSHDIGLYEKELAPQLKELEIAILKSLKEHILDRDIKIHSVSSRVKTTESLAQKITRPDRSYEDLFDITDLLAFRIITYSEDIITDVAGMIESLFKVDYSNSVNKLQYDDLQRFGYRSLHYICGLPKDSQNDSIPSTFRFEIQIRTILQHTWAEIEHDIGYKATEQLPKEIRRKFSQVASLLEIADRDFAAIRKELKTYEEGVKKGALDIEDIEVDLISLQTILDSQIVQEMDSAIARHLNSPLDEDSFYPNYLVNALMGAGFLSISQLQEAATLYQEELYEFIPLYFKFLAAMWGIEESSLNNVKKGYSLLLLSHIYLYHQKKLNIDKIKLFTNLYELMDYPEDRATAKEVAKVLIDTLSEAQFLGTGSES